MINTPLEPLFPVCSFPGGHPSPLGIISSSRYSIVSSVTGNSTLDCPLILNRSVFYILTYTRTFTRTYPRIHSHTYSRTHTRTYNRSTSLPPSGPLFGQRPSPSPSLLPGPHPDVPRKVLTSSSPSPSRPIRLRPPWREGVDCVRTEDMWVPRAHTGPRVSRGHVGSGLIGLRMNYRVDHTGRGNYSVTGTIVESSTRTVEREWSGCFT